ncbi:hypothetical protein F5X99DRAFT_430148 [Biscogniauxia marginata]|nr:hypothetical protein F5X99DRAFT_430148 [Biscogniauxia marginata]
MYGGDIPSEASRLQDAVNSLSDERPSTYNDDDDESADPWGSESTSSTDTSSTESNPWYDVEEVEQQWRAVVINEAQRTNTGERYSQQEDEADPLLDTWHEEAEWRWWQQEGSFLVMLAKHSYTDKFQNARQAYPADPWDISDKTEEFKEQICGDEGTGRGSQKTGSPLTECVTIEY